MLSHMDPFHIKSMILKKKSWAQVLDLSWLGGAGRSMSGGQGGRVRELGGWVSGFARAPNE